MKYPCGIIKDILPLYIDEVCTPESKEAVEEHISNCESCKSFYDAMQSTDGFSVPISVEEDVSMANSLKAVKQSISKKILYGILCTATAIAMMIGGMYLLFNASIKDVPIDDVVFSANVYPLTEMIVIDSEKEADSDPVTIYSDEDDRSEIVTVKIPELGQLELTEKTINRCKYASVIFVESDYFLREVKKDCKNNVMYITAIQTSILNNKTDLFRTQMVGLEFQEINKIVYVNDDGTETVLWSK